MRTIERIVLPFEARSLTPADTKPESFAEGVAKRQLLVRGSDIVGSSLIRTGSAMIAAGSPRIPVKSSSALMRKSTTGKSQMKLIPSDKTPAPSRNNRWRGYEQDVRSKTGTSNPSTRTRMRNPNMVRSGWGLTLTGGFIPILSRGYVAHSVLFPEYDIVEDVRSRPQRTADYSIDGITNSWNALSPVPKFIASVAINSVLGVFS